METLKGEDAKEDISPRVVGAFIFVCGLVLAYFGYVQPLMDISRGASEIALSSKVAFLAPLATGLGLVYLVFGNLAVKLFGSPREISPKGFLLFIPLVVISFLLKNWLESQVLMSGYQ